MESSVYIICIPFSNSVKTNITEPSTVSQLRTPSISHWDKYYFLCKFWFNHWIKWIVLGDRRMAVGIWWIQCSVLLLFNSTLNDSEYTIFLIILEDKCTAIRQFSEVFCHYITRTNFSSVFHNMYFIFFWALKQNVFQIPIPTNILFKIV